jgi:peptide/nickel transport system permease protein
VISRSLSTIPVLVAASIVIFAAMRVLPGDPVTILAQGTPLTPQQRAQLTREYHLDQSVPTQYVEWVKGVFHGDLGRSLSSNEPVSTIVTGSLPRTLVLLFGGFVFSLLLAIPLGILAALREGTVLEQGIISFTMVLLSIPLFISCVLAIYLFSYRWNLLPAFGFRGNGGVEDVFKHMLLPWITLGLALVAVQTATLRAGLLDVLKQEYVLMAQSRGLPWRYVLRRHALRSALVPVVTLLGLQLSYMIVGSVFVDNIFGLGGLGSILVNAVNFRDMPVVQACVMIVSAFFVFANLLVDLIAARLDPRYAVR